MANGASQEAEPFLTEFLRELVAPVDASSTGASAAASSSDAHHGIKAGISVERGRSTIHLFSGARDFSFLGASRLSQHAR
jgi:hypothetical protein